MLNKIIQSYQHSKLATIKKFSGHETGSLDEPGCLDDSFIKTKIEDLKKEYTKMDQQIEQLIHFDKEDEYNKQKLKTLFERKEEIHLYLAFLSSNSLMNIESAIHLMKDQKSHFSMCLEALYHWKEKREIQAYTLLEEFFSLHSEPLEHYLINKVYGILLIRHNQFDQAARFLRKAAEKRPEDLELHVLLKNTYKVIGDLDQIDLHDRILKLLGGDENGHDLFSQ
ncbi:hypothetical protein [Rossellomorea vietnamensis]|uniref:hypothetical protein n=1 Tax=Rossellomorea vietnamensis TaxID=218284 RepID=UPI001E578EAF|nr:hypothetical protein [Rossellomorea vietnamensis]MCC5804673.1 hypothetical protein [Rossellomorea vietnamensis]